MVAGGFVLLGSLHLGFDLGDFLLGGHFESC